MRNTYCSILMLLIAAGLMTSCKDDDWDYAADGYTISTDSDDDDDDEDEETDSSDISTIYIAYSGTSATVTGDSKSYVTVSGADVTVNTGTANDSLLIVLSGNTTDGSLLVYREAKYGLQLNGVSITNSDGSAINNQCHKSLYLTVADGTVNTLADGSNYATQTYDQKGALFSEGQIYFSGSGSLTVTGNYKHAIACDDYIVFDEATLNASSSAGNGIKVSDGIWINGGTMDISVTADAARGIKCDSVVVVNGGNTTISTSGDCVYDTTEADYSSAACIKCDYDFLMTDGVLTMTSSGDGGKGVNSSGSVTVSGGTFSAITTGSNDEAKPKAVKGVGITVSGGSFTAQVNKSWACDNGSDSETPANRLTVVGTPVSSSIAKKSVVIKF